jgi:S-(hydroxymethyl)glutathione dehydrogenase/alcohol dehydrogenase
MGAKLAGAGTIIAVDALSSKLKMAKRLGADVTINVKRQEPVGKIMELTGGGADYALECIGNVNVMAQAFAAIRFGGKFVVVGMAPLGTIITAAPFEFLLGKTMTGTVQGDIRPSVDIPRFIDLYMNGKLPIDKLISHTYTLGQVNEAFEALERGEVIRSVIKF